MRDILPFPNIAPSSPAEMAAQINTYLATFKETLEFVLTNITTENLSQDLVNRLNELGAQIEKADEVRNDQVQQVTQKMITVSDVMNSAAFKAHTKSMEEYTDKKLDELDYIVSGEQTVKSTESSGLNVYTFTDKDGKTSTFEVRNGEKGEQGEKGDSVTVSLSVDYETGNLLYEEQIL